MIHLIVFFTTVFINYCDSNCCCKCCSCCTTCGRTDEINNEGYFNLPGYLNNGTLNKKTGDKNPNGQYNFDENYDKFTNTSNLDERPTTSPELFLDSGIHYRTPLNMIWANNNCAILSVVRLLISEKNFLDRLLNKKLVDPSKFKFIKKNSTEELLAKSIIPEILDKTSNLFKSILNGKVCSFQNLLDWLPRQLRNDENDYINNHINDPNRCISEFIFLYLRNDFECVIDDIQKRMKSKILSYMTPSSCHKGDECNTGKYILFECEPKKVKAILDEDIEIVQSSGETKYYELIGSTWVCGNVLNPTPSDADHVCIVPVFDKNKKKLGYVKYQFNEVSDVKPLTYWNNIDKFGTWEDPRPYVAIYRLKGKDMKLQMLNK